MQVLKLPRVLRVRAVFRGGYGNTEFSGAEDRPERQDAVAVLRDSIETRARLWEALRPWYRKNIGAWKDSFWAIIAVRNALVRFVDAVRRQDEWEGQEAIKEMASPSVGSQWTNDVRNGGSLLGNPADGLPWFRDALGFLMFAAMPSRKEERTTDLGAGLGLSSWAPGQENIREAFDYGFQPVPIQADQAFVESQVLTRRHPLGNDRGNRVALLERLQTEFRAGRPKVSMVVPRAILNEFRVQVEALIQWAQKNKHAEGVWGPFDFKLPNWTPPSREKKVGMEPRGDFDPQKYNGDAPIQPDAATVPGGQQPPAQPSGQQPQQPQQPQQSQQGGGQGGGGPPANWRNNEWRARGQQGQNWQNNSWQNRSQQPGGGGGGGDQSGGGRGQGDRGRGQGDRGRGQGDRGRGGGQQGGGGRGGGGQSGGGRGGGGQGGGGRGGGQQGGGGQRGGGRGGNRRGMMMRRTAAALDSHRTHLYTVGEVGDHRSADDLWLLVDADGGGYDVYDATGEYGALARCSAG